MAALHQHAWLSSFNSTNAFFSSSNHHKHSPFRLSFSQTQSNDEANSLPVSPNSEKTASESAQGPVDPVKLALEKAKAYKKTKMNPNSETKQNPVKEIPASVKVEMEKAREFKDNGSESRNGKNGEKKEKLSISSIDFVGLNFADKKTSRGLPPGLVPVLDPFPEGNLPDVEIIVGDTTKFGEATTTSEPNQTTEDNSEFYKPKVSTWGVFPRPGNISKTV